MTYRLSSSLVVLLTLSACAGLLPPTQVPMIVAPAWQAPLPHQGQVESLAHWWQQQGDLLLAELIVAAQAASPTVSQALSGIAAARASQAAANAALLPNLSGQASASRAVSQPDMPLATTLQGGLQTSWELDLVGANRAISQAAQAQFEGSQARWHDARVSVAAEVASRYYSHVTCSQQLAVASRDAASRQETARLMAIGADAGLQAPSMAVLARASAAEAGNRVSQHMARCEFDLKALVALTALSEPDLKQKMAQALTDGAQVAMFNIANVPAQTISQRPDVFVAERDLVQASAQVGSAQAQRWPRLSLNGAIGAMRVNNGSARTDLSTWSFGPLSLSVPLFDGGKRAADVAAAQAHYQTAVMAYQGQVRQAVREVEEALVSLHSVDARSGYAQLATQGYAESLRATQVRFNQGLASLLELEDARRSALAAESAELALKLERRLAWIALYRAVGGGFEPGSTSMPSSPARPLLH